jgi:hypothetical protein
MTSSQVHVFLHFFYRTGVILRHVRSTKKYIREKVVVEVVVVVVVVVVVTIIIIIIIVQLL